MASDQGRPDDPHTDPAAADDGAPPRQRDLEDDPLVAAGGDAEPAAAADYDAGAERRRGLAVRLFQGTVALLAVAVFLGVVWYAYIWGTAGGGNGGGLPVVEAPTRPEKVKPDDPGGMEVQHQDKVVLNDEAAEGEVERLLPPPETPRPPDPVPDTESAGTSGTTDTAEAGEATEGTAPPADGSDAPADGDTGAGASGDAALPEQEVAELPETTPPDGGAGGGTAADTSDSDAGEAASDDGTGQSEAEPDTEAGPEPEPTQPAAARDGDFAVQLAAFRDEAGARAAWDRFRERYPELLGDLQLLLQRTEIEGQGTFWRVRTGPFAQKSAADALCAKLKDRGQDCLSVGR